MTAIVLRGDARQLPLPDESVDLIVTSPPYFGLRSYTDGGEHYDGQIGSEATPQAYLEALWACTAEWVRVLKPGGSMFINLGDKYSTSWYSHNSIRTVPQPDGEWSKTGQRGKPNVQPIGQDPGVPPKSLMGIPWRYAIGCTDRLGLILRAEIIWAKPNGLPESVTDRVRRAHEQVFHFTRQPRYYAAVDEIREPQLHPNGTQAAGVSIRKQRKAGYRSYDGQYDAPNPLGKLPGSVWSIPSAPLQVPAHLGIDHFAAFPPALVRPLVLGWSPPGVCTVCGEGRRPVVDVGYIRRQWDRPGTRTERNGDNNRNDSAQPFGSSALRSTTITGYACACPQPDAPTRPAVCLDPFGGTGTTALVATTHGRIGITVDRSADYCRLAAWRVTDPGERARARDMPKPPPVPDGMEPLFPLTW